MTEGAERREISAHLQMVDVAVAEIVLIQRRLASVRPGKQRRVSTDRYLHQVVPLQNQLFQMRQAEREGRRQRADLVDRTVAEAKVTL